MRNDTPLGVEPWHPCANEGVSSRLWWSVFVCAAACINGDRRIFRGGKVRRTDPPSGDDAKWLAELIADTDQRRIQARELLLHASAFCRGLLDYDLARLSGPRPRLLDYDTATSMSAWWYGALTTNPSFNPLSWVALALGQSLYPDVVWHGFPRKRSCRLSSVLEGHDGRVEWSLVGRVGEKVVCIEPRSITANHIGDKSKEIFDRIEETRQAAKRAKVEVEIVGVLDGDFDQEALQSVAGAHGYDVVMGIEDAIRDADGAVGIRRAGESALARMEEADSSTAVEAPDAGHG
jgi:hypothetical protein